VARTTADAARELLDSGRAKPGDTARVFHREHTPFTIDLARVVAYRPSAAAQSVTRSKRIHHYLGADFSPERSPAFYSAAN
jgi:hypothetical protein